MPGAGGEEVLGRRDGVGQRQPERRHEQLAEEVERGALRRAGELLAVLLGAEHRAGVRQPGLQPGVPADAVADDVDELGGAALAVEVLGLVAGGGDVLEDRVLGAEAGLDVGQRLVEQLGDVAQPVDRADVAPGGVELARAASRRTGRSGSGPARRPASRRRAGRG